MANVFVGKFVVDTRENFDGFLEGIGVPSEFIEMARNAKVVSEFAVDGDRVTVTRTRPQKTTTNTFKLGEETEMDTIKGDKIKATVNLIDGKMVAKGDQYEVISEIVDGKLKETITLKGHTMTRYSVRQS